MWRLGVEVRGFSAEEKAKMRHDSLVRSIGKERNLEFGPSPDASKTMRRPLPVSQGEAIRGPSAPQTPVGMTQRKETPVGMTQRKETQSG